MTNHTDDEQAELRRENERLRAERDALVLSYRVALTENPLDPLGPGLATLVGFPHEYGIANWRIWKAIAEKLGWVSPADDMGEPTGARVIRFEPSEEL